MKYPLFALAAVGFVVGCSPSKQDSGITAGVLPPGPETRVATLSSTEVPPALAALVQEHLPNFTVVEVERKDREGRVYYDIGGTQPDGSVLELDIQEIGGRFEVVEIQRDVAFADMPPAAQTATRAAAGAFSAERIIESRQMDRTVIYELFAPGQTDEPAMEVRVREGVAEVLTERWPH